MNFNIKLLLSVSISLLLLSYSIFLNVKSIKLTDEFLIHTHIKEQPSTKLETILNSQKYMLYASIVAIAILLFALYKLLYRYIESQKRLLLGKKSEKHHKNMHSKLLKYSNELEKKISQKRAQLELNTYTHFLSALPNRNRLLEDSSIYDFKQMALLNIDKFQKFNDVYGEDIGNIALKLSADFLGSKVDKKSTFLYHIGGDEFVIAVKDSTELNNTLFIKKIEDILKSYQRESFIYEDQKFSFMMSAGLAFSGSKKMMAYADMALKDAKKRNIGISIFNDDKELEKLHKEDMECYDKLSFALENDNVISYFQPISALQNASLSIKYESLVRIRDRDGTIISPFRFLDVAKQNRIYYKITKAVLRNTLDAISKYNIDCSLNLSMEDLENDRTLEMLYREFDKFEHNHNLTIELLETEEFKDYKRVYDFCMRVRSYGIKVALDDFGSGYSNFSHILNMPIDYIKIDSSLISNIDRDINSQIMVSTIVGLANKLKIYTIAEFVSSKEILDVVKGLNVDYAQGYYVGKPQKIESYIPYLLD